MRGKKKLPNYRNPNQYNAKRYQKKLALPDYLIAPLDIEKIEKMEAEIDALRAENITE